MIYDWIRKNNIMPITKVDVDNAIRYSQDKYIEERANASKTQFKTVLDEKSVEFRKKKLAREYIIMKYFEKVNEIEVVKSITENQFQ
jgi:hypothetical protein